MFLGHKPFAIFAVCLAFTGLGVPMPASAAGDPAQGRPAQGRPAQGRPAQGRIVFARCAACHDLKPGVKKIGPSLAGILGRKAGSMPGFAYSPAMKASTIVWTPAKIDAFIARPIIAVPGTKMMFMGLSNPADRANVIAYLAGAAKQ